MSEQYYPFECADDFTLESLQTEILAAGLNWEIAAYPNKPHPEGHTATMYVMRVSSWGGDAVCRGFGEPRCLLAEALRRYRADRVLPMTSGYKSTKPVTTEMVRLAIHP